ncbi:ferric iron reductase [Pelagibacterium montanilacus]|uniref:ferric iron reductase n=1 Tax=Pelagibacterium montanilacus TaxID=2185280 RepID=UPI000F8E90F7|nr:ferric iron reductase [Pelagibacterium montanilacus]
MEQTPHEIMTRHQALADHQGPYSPRFVLAPPPADAVPIDRGMEQALSVWLDEEIERTPGADRKLAAAYTMGRISWSLALPLAGLALSGAWLIEAREGSASASVRLVTWQHEGESGVAPVFDAALSPRGARFSALPDAAGADRFRQAYEILLAPLVDSLHAASGLPRAALWRLAGDSLSAGFLEAGTEAGDPERAMTLVLPMLREKGSPLYARQTGFVRARLPERPDVCGWFRARGGCCRYYTAEGGEYCTTCVLRDPKSRKDRLIDHLRRTHPELAA